jgi:lysophospholipase L1-like esterase
MRAGEPPNLRLIVVPSASYPTRLQSMLSARYAAQTILVGNGGIPGETAENGARRLPNILANERPDVVLLMEGANDLSRLTLGLAAVSIAAQAIDAMAKESRNRGARVFLATIPPPKAGGNRALPVASVTALNDQIRLIARGEGAVLVDTNAAIAADLNRYVGVDGLHLTEAGYQRVAEVFFDAIRADLEAC